MNKKNLLIVTSEFPPLPGGIGNHCYNLALQLSKNGYLVVIIADQRSNDRQEEIEFDSSLPFKVCRTSITAPRFFMYIKRMFSILRLAKTTHQIIATGKFSLWSVAICSWFYKRRYVAIVHGTEVNFKAYVLKTAVEASLKQFHSVIAVSKYTKQLIVHIRPSTLVIPNGLDLKKWQRSTKTIGAGLAGYPSLITVGNVTSRKGQQNVIRQLPKLLIKYPELHYHCVGLKTEAASFLDLAIELNVESHVTFHGRLCEAELIGVLEKSDIFVMLSTETGTGDVEGFGIAILEANALGLPAIGAKGCGIEDAIKDGSSGILVSGSDAQEFLDAIQIILGRQEAFKLGALEWASKHHWDDIIKRYIQVIEGDALNLH